MPDFVARICRDYRDVNGLVLDCTPDSLSATGERWENVAPPARVATLGRHTDVQSATTLKDSTKYWRVNQHVGKVAINLTDGSMGLVSANTYNTATVFLSGGTLNNWSFTDRYVLTTFRPGNPYQDDPDKRPNVVTTGGLQAAEFTRANYDHFGFDVSYPFKDRYLTTMVDVASMDGTANGQCVVGFPNYKFRARNGSGNYEYQYNSTQQPGSAALTAGVWLFNAESASTAKVWENGTEDLNGTFARMDVDDGEPRGYIGCSNGTSEFLDATLRHVALWDRRLSPLERDFAFGSFLSTISYSAWSRPVVTVENWTDDTDSTQAIRVNPRPEGTLKYLLAKGAANCRLQIAATVDGVVQQDGALGSRLITIDAVEEPSASPAIFHTSTGWSSVIDIELKATGHYTFVVFRPAGGRYVLHVDAEIS